MEKEELLHKIEMLELSRLNDLSCEEVKAQSEEWFGEACSGNPSKKFLINEYIIDFMCWKEQCSTQELKELVSSY